MLAIQTLGSFSVRTPDGRECRPRPRECALLAYLACNGDRPLAREVLADLFWPAVPAARGLHSLSQAVYRLSKSIPGIAFEAKPSELRLPSVGIQVDAVDFERAIRAAEYTRAKDLYTGPFLYGMQLESAPEFTAWQDQTRARLASAAELMFRELLSEAESKGDWESVEACCEALRGFNPHDDLAACIQVGSLLVRGARFEARRLYEHVRRTMQEVGQDPSPKLLRIAERLQSDGGDEPLPQPSLKLVGRTREFERLKSLLTRAERGCGSAVVVSGIAGVGKTRLCQQLIRLAAIRGCRIFQCGGTSVTRGVGYSSASELFGSPRAGEVERIPAEFQRILVAGLLNPAIREGTPSEPLDKWTLAEAVVSLIAAVAETAPMVLFADDLQWVDDASIELLHFIAHRLRGERVLVVAAVRPEEIEAGSVAVEVSRSSCFETLPLRELTLQGAQDLLQAFSEASIHPLSRTAVDQISRLAGGHAFFLLELAKAHFSEQRISPSQTLEIPETVHQFITRRFSMLSGTALALADALAILGGPARADVLCSVAGLDAQEFANGIEELVTKGMCVDSGRGTSFVHELVRECAYDRLVTARRIHYHARAFRALREAGADPARLAYHSERADNPTQTHRYASIAARLAEARYGPGEAEPLWRLAAICAPTKRLKSLASEQLAGCLFALHNTDAGTLYEGLLRSGHLGKFKTVLYRARRMVIAVRCGAHVTEEEWTSVFEEAEVLKEARERVGVFECLYYVTMGSDNAKLLRRFMPAAATAVAEAGATPASIHLLGRLAEAAALSGDFSRSEEFANIALAMGGGDARATWRASAAMAMCDILRGRASAADARYREIVESLSKHPRLAVVDLLSNWAVIRMEMEKFDEARNDFEYCRDFYEATRHPVAASRAEANLAALEWEAGNPERAAKHAESSLAAGRSQHTTGAGLAHGIAGLSALQLRWASECEHRSVALASWRDLSLIQTDLSYAYMFLARMSEREGKYAEALKRIEEGLVLYAGRDFFCHARLQLEKARLIGVKDAEAGLALAREVRARALEGEATLLLNKSEALIRELKRGGQAQARGGGRDGVAAVAKKKVMPRMTRRRRDDGSQSQ